MKQSKFVAFFVAAVFGMSVSAMAQGRGGGPPAGGPPAGGPPAGAGAGMGGSGMGSSMGQQMGQMGQSQRGHMGQSQRGQMGQMGQTGTHSRRPAVSDLLTQNTKLSSQLQSILGSNVDLQTASSGFKNLGQFVAAVHVYKNLKIPGTFDQFSTTIQQNKGNLGKAIQSVSPNLSNRQVKSAVRTANRQAKQDIRNSKG